MFRISSYNCKSAKRNAGGIARLCENSDIVLLQEHWLFPSDLPSLNNIHNDFVAYGISSIDPSQGLILGRPFGGVAVLWRNNLSPFVRPISFNDDRIVALECCINGLKILLIGVYLPYDNKQNFAQYVHYLAMLKSIIDEYDSPYVCILGDFNADIVKQTDFGKELEGFCQETSLKVADILLLPQTSFTHINDGSSTESWLDHILCTNGSFSIIDDVRIDLSIASSDHFPISLKLQLQGSDVGQTAHDAPDCDGRWVVDWSTVDDAGRCAFTEAVDDELAKIDVPYDAAHCVDSECLLHRDVIVNYYEDIINCVRLASQSTVAKRINGRNKRIIPGWSEFVEEKHILLGDIYSLWALVGKPREGYIYRQLCVARCQFKYALRFCLRNEKDLRAKALADKFAKNPRDTGTFWKEVHKLNSNPPLAQTVEGISGEANIAAMWKDHFADILNSVKNQDSKDAVLKKLVESVPCDLDISVTEVVKAISELSSGRSAGCDELTVEHFKFAGVSCAIHMSLCFSMMLKHSFLPPSLTKVVLTPIVKDKTGKTSDKDNYRPIALATVSSKVLERVILNCCRSHLDTSDHQFGFKGKHSTDMAVFALKEITDYYLSNRSPVFICFVDARKAFDRVNHWTLFDKLLRRGMHTDIVKLLVNWYETQKFHVRWGSTVTEGFCVSNGVRQGGILSPYLFNVYTDELSERLDMSGVGCRYLGSINHLCYADDMVLLSPTPQGLQKLLDVCANYAATHDILFNTKKTVCMALLPNLFKHMALPDITLCGKVLSYVDLYKYLGYHLSNSQMYSDDMELRHQYRLLCCRANSLTRKFAMCTYPVRRYLYATYCSNIAGVHLWHSHRSHVLRKFIVCFNNAARMFLGYDRFCSASNMFVSERIDSFHAMYRKAVFRFMTRLGQSDNRIVSNLFNSDLVYHSSMRKTWTKALCM